MLTKLKEQIKLALRVKSNARAARFAAVLDYQAAVKELCSLKVRWHDGQISQRTYQVYKADTTELRKALELDAVGYKKVLQLAHSKHDQLLTEYAEELKRAKAPKGRAEHLLSSMSHEDIDALKRHFAGK